MKKHYQTELHEVFSVSKMITIYPSINLYEKRNDKFYGHDFWQIIHIKDDQSVKIDGEVKIPLKKDSVVFRGPGEVFVIGSERQKDHYVGIISFECNSSDMEFFKDRIFQVGSEEKKCLQEIFSIGERAFEVVRGTEYHGCRLRDNCSPITLQLLKNNLERLIFLLYVHGMEANTSSLRNEEKQQQKNRLFIEEVENYMREHISENLSIHDIARSFMVSSSTLKYAFKDVLGEGVITYFRQLKMEEAKRRLETEDTTVEIIAEELGFDSSSYFAKVFRSKTGMSPLEYRASRRRFYE